jgi:hypothetical protein
MMKPNLRAFALPAAALVGAALLGACGTPPSAGPPPEPTTCFVRAKGDNAILEVTAVGAARTCREFQAWSLKETPNRVLELSEVRPDPATLVPSRFPLTVEQIDAAPVVKETCRYTLDGATYAVTDTGGQAIGQGWCKHFYTRSVEAQARADARAPRS